MKKIYLLLFIILIKTSVFLCGCEEKDYTNYENAEGYSEYVSCAEKGCEYATYYDIPESIINNEKALKYYKGNIRKYGDYMITNYLDGICINNHIGEIKNCEIIIPETIDGKPVIAIGAYFHNTYRNSDDLYDRYMGAFDSDGVSVENLKIHLPSSLKYIGSFTADSQRSDTIDIIDFGAVDFIVDEDNPYYASAEGSLYTKDMKTLLYMGNTAQHNNFVSEQTENIYYSNESGYVGI